MPAVVAPYDRDPLVAAARAFHLGADPEAQIAYGAPADELAAYCDAVAEKAARSAAISEGAAVGLSSRPGSGRPRLPTATPGPAGPLLGR